jgi:hypothetical protein
MSVGHVGRVGHVSGRVNHVAHVGSRFGGRVVHIGWPCRLLVMAGHLLGES